MILSLKDTIFNQQMFLLDLTLVERVKQLKPQASSPYLGGGGTPPGSSPNSPYYRSPRPLAGR